MVGGALDGVQHGFIGCQGFVLCFQFCFGEALQRGPEGLPVSSGHTQGAMLAPPPTLSARGEAEVQFLSPS